ncbi:MAG: hypothetical protein GX605_02240 [Chloroflexi bacterium]|nr:hypothetical protein [Chloroflexota bacterium]
MSARSFKGTATVVLVAMLGTLLAGCAAPATPQIVEKIVEKPVVQTVVVETEKVVEKSVVQTVVVETEKVVEKVVEKEVGATRGGVVEIGLNREPDSLDPHVSSSRYDGHVEWVVYQGLACLHPEKLTYEPSLATSWEQAADGKSLVVKLREGIKFHDGTDFNAEAVKINIERIMNPDTKSENSVFAQGPLESVEVVDNYTVKFTYSEPFGQIGAALAAAWMISPAAIQEHGQALYNHMVGTGPFKFVEWEARSHVTVERFEEYVPDACDTHEGPAYLEKVTWRFIPENSTRMAALQAGQVDMVRSIPADQWNIWAGNPNFKTAKTPQGGIGSAIMLNTTKPPTDDLRVRQALNYMLDRKQIILGYYAGINSPQPGPLSPFTLGYEPKSELYPFDPEKGLALLEEAGWKINEATGKMENAAGEQMKFEFLILTSAQDMAVVTKGLLEEYGIACDIIAEDNPAQQQHGQQGLYHFVGMFWSSLMPTLAIQLFSCENVGSGWNFGQYCSEETEELFNKSKTEIDFDKSIDLLKQAQIKLAEDAAVFPIAVAEVLWAMEQDIMGFRTLGGEQVKLHDMYRILE